jgi:hypothetical protein
MPKSATCTNAFLRAFEQVSKEIGRGETGLRIVAGTLRQPQQKRHCIVARRRATRRYRFRLEPHVA